MPKELTPTFTVISKACDGDETAISKILEFYDDVPRTARIHPGRIFARRTRHTNMLTCIKRQVHALPFYEYPARRDILLHTRHRRGIVIQYVQND